MSTYQMVNGIDSYMETFQEICMALGVRDDDPLPKEVRECGGTTAIYDLARELTNEFELLNRNRLWDGEFFDEIELFIDQKFGDVKA